MSKNTSVGWIEPQAIADDLRASMEDHHDKTVFDPANPSDLLTMARWGRPFGLFEADALATWHGPAPYPKPRVPDAEIAGWIG